MAKGWNLKTNQKSFARALLFGLVSTILVGQFSYAQTKPNIVFVFVDDMRWDMMGSMGLNNIIKTPVMDSLANKGVLFKNAYVTTAICMASRASVYLGEHQNRAVDNRIVAFGDVITADRMKRTIHGVLQANNYYTGWVGKNHLHSSTVAGFDFKNTASTTYTQQEGGKPIHLTTFMTNRALEFLDKVPANRPFYLNLNTFAPHAEDSKPAGQQMPPEPDLVSLYKNDVIPVPPTADPAFYNALPAFLQGGELRSRWNLRYTPELFQEQVKNYYRLISGVDRQLGLIVAKIKDMGRADNTIIVLMGDNGMFLGERGYADKWLAHEHSIRVPFFVHDPRAAGHLKGMVREEMVLNIDVAPTILSLAGFAIPKQMQGTDLTPLLKNQDTQWRTDFYYEHPWTNNRIPISYALVESQYKYIEYKDHPEFIELYDVIKDPYEMDNLAYKAEFKSRLDAMKSRFAELKKSSYEDDEIKERLMPVATTAIAPKGAMQPTINARMENNLLVVFSSVANGNFRVTDLKGSVIRSGSLDGNGNAQISLGTGLQSGIYLLDISAGKDVKERRMVFASAKI